MHKQSLALLFILLPWSSCKIVLSSDPNDVKFYFYPFPRKPNVTVEIRLDEWDHFMSQSIELFKPNNPTVIFVHGFYEHYQGFSYVSRPLLEKNVPVNVIQVEWSRLARGTFQLALPLAYIKIVKTNVPIVANKLSELLLRLQSLTLTSPERIHLIGLSLGAQICGYAGAIYFQRTGKRVARITGLDPAGPLYEPPVSVNEFQQLTKDKALFVDAYHTDVGKYGTILDVGHADFFINGGKLQPGCVIVSDPFTFCSHLMAARFFVASITTEFVGCQCSGKELDKHECEHPCRNSVVAGFYTPNTAIGDYFFRAENLPPVPPLGFKYAIVQ